MTLDILDETGKSILGGAIDDSFGVESLTGFELTVSGSYFIVINSYDGSPGDFTLTLAEAGTAATDEGEDDRVRTVITSGSALNFSEFYKASLDGATEATFTFPGKANEFADVTVSPLTEGLDVVIDLLDPSGASLLPESPWMTPTTQNTSALCACQWMASIPSSSPVMMAPRVILNYSWKNPI
ncbi:MAG: hypothetical protein M5U34_22835 [Chloroflexi bacterium]|nr:hypothetical protein [Chloroflexota bacterium]